VQVKSEKHQKTCTMIGYKSQKQLMLEGFDTPPGMLLDLENRWVKLSDCIP
jgi:hypothetical protein